MIKTPRPLKGARVQQSNWSRVLQEVQVYQQSLLLTAVLDVLECDPAPSVIE